MSANEIEEFMKAWLPIEEKLKHTFNKRFPKLDFFINKILATLGISKRISHKISSGSSSKYEIIWKEIF